MSEAEYEQLRSRYVDGTAGEAVSAVIFTLLTGLAVYFGNGHRNLIALLFYDVRVLVWARNAYLVALGTLVVITIYTSIVLPAVLGRYVEMAEVSK